MERQIKVAAISGDLDWGYRQSCSGDHFDLDTARAYIESYTARLAARIEAAAVAGAQVVLAPEYAFGAEMFAPVSGTTQQQLAEHPDGATFTMLSALCRRLGIVFCGAGNVDHVPHGVQQTGILIDDSGALSLQVKHPRTVPDPPDWPFESVPVVYPTAVAVMGITVCSDCTHDPVLPLEMGRLGMEVLLLPGCGFMSDKWLHFIVVRARDTQCPVIYADDGHAAIVSSAGDVIARTGTAGETLYATIQILPKKSSPDAA